MRIKELFFKPTQVAATVTTVTETPTIKPTKKRSSSAEETPETPLACPVDAQDFVKSLEKDLHNAAAKADGYDYMKFRDTLAKLKTRVPDEEARFAAAGAAAQAMKVTAADLIASAQEYIAVLDKQSTAFDADMKDIKAENTQKQAELRKVQQQISELEDQKATLEKEVAKSQKVLECGRAAFDTAYDSLVAGIKDDAAKIKKYL